MAVESVPPASFYKSRVETRDFSGGMVTDTDPAGLAENELRLLHNLFPRKRGYLQLRTGQRFAVSTTAFIDGFIRFTTGGGALSRLVYAMQGSVYAYNQGTQTTTTIYSAPAHGDQWEFAVLYDRVLWVETAYNSPVRAWDGVSATASLLGVTPPAASPNTGVSTSTTTGSNLNSDNGNDPLQYYITYQNARGVESNPAIYGLPVYGVSPNYASLFTATLTGLANFASTDPSVTTINIYRAGGGLVNPLRVGSVANGTNTFVDNTANVSLSDIVLSYSHDAPPLGCNLIYAGKSRLFLVKGNTVYVSTLGQPDYFPLTVTNAAIDGMVFDVEPDAENPIVALGGAGSTVLIARARNMYLFQGDSVDNFSIGKVCDVGCVAKRSLVQCVDTPIWLAPDANVWMLGASGPQCLTRDTIARTLKAIPPADLPGACACYFDNQYHLSIPSSVNGAVGSTYLVYDLQTGAWSDLSASAMGATQLYANTGQSYTGELYFATAQNYPGQTAFTFANGIVAALGLPTTPGYGTDQAFDVWSGDLVFGRPDWIKKIYAIEVRGRLVPAQTPGTPAPTLTLYARNEGDADATAVSVSYPLTPTSGAEGTLLKTRVDASICGQRISWEIKGTASQFELSEIILAPIPVRERRQ